MTDEQRRTLAAATERILPSGDGPGAAEANVMGCIEWILRQGTLRAQQRFLSGVDLLRDLARESHGKDFADCDPAVQDGVLAQIQSIPHPIAQRFFWTLTKLTLAGFLSDPVHGGNRNGVGWRYLGFDPVQPPPTPEVYPEG